MTDLELLAACILSGQVEAREVVAGLIAKIGGQVQQQKDAPNEPV